MRKSQPESERTAAIRLALECAGQSSPIVGMRSLSGGCIHQVVGLELSDGVNLIAKINSAENKKLFEEEAHSLRTLAATKTVIVPEPLAVAVENNIAVLLMTAIQPPAQRNPAAVALQQFGIDLASLHQAPAGNRYGFEIDNHLGSTFQPNQWCDDWVEFNALHRLGFQLQTAVESGLIGGNEVRTIETVINRLDQFIPRRPKPALLHGDLWSGNAMPTLSPRIQDRATYAVIDPACSIGDGWADIAMMKLFGGFGHECFQAYSAAQSSDRDNIEARLTVYQLYHVLNHVNIFGQGYGSQTMALARRLLG